MINLWEWGLKTTQGALGPVNSFYYIINLKLAKVKFKYAKKSYNKIELIMKDHEGKLSEVEIMNTIAAKETHDIYLPLDTRNERKKSYMEDIANKWCRQGMLVFLKRNNTW